MDGKYQVHCGGLMSYKPGWTESTPSGRKIRPARLHRVKAVFPETKTEYIHSAFDEDGAIEMFKELWGTEIMNHLVKYYVEEVEIDDEDRR
jgi:hypothetical protein